MAMEPHPRTPRHFNSRCTLSARALDESTRTHAIAALGRLGAFFFRGYDDAGEGLWSMDAPPRLMSEDEARVEIVILQAQFENTTLALVRAV